MAGVLAVYGLGELVGHNADDVEEAFRAFAPVKSVRLSDTMALVEFNSTEHAQHALNSATGMFILGVAVKVELAASGGWAPPPLPPAASVQGRAAVVMPARPLWPPVYELAGEAWSLHPGSGGLLYEPLSEFFFSPQTRLYYSCRERFYYSLTLEEGPLGVTPTFHRIEGQAMSSASVPSVNAQAQVKKLLRKEPVLFSLPSAAAAPAIRKEAAAVENMAKWGALSRGDEKSGKEEKQEERQKSDVVVVVPPASLVAAAASALAAKGGISGGAVCFLCRRLFSDPGMLARHERDSTLHAQNVVADADDGADSCNGETGAAAKRPRVAGVVAGVMLAASHEGRARARSFHAQQPPSPPSSPIPPAAPAPPVSLLSDTSNRGNKLLRKMGWSEGRGLGKQEDGVAASLASKSEASRPHGQSHAGIGMPVVASIPQISYNKGKDAYRSSLKLAAKARFDQLG